MIALNPVVQVLAIDMADCVLWPEPVVDLADHLGVTVRLVSDDGQGLIQANGLSGLPQKRPCSLGISPRGQPKIDQLAELIDGAP